MGMALAAKRGKGHFSKKIHDIADSMSEKQLHDFAATKHKGLPEKKAYVLPSGLIPNPVNPGPDPDPDPLPKIDIDRDLSYPSVGAIIGKALLRGALIGAPIAYYHYNKAKQREAEAANEKSAEIISAIKHKLDSLYRH